MILRITCRLPFRTLPDFSHAPKLGHIAQPFSTSQPLAGRGGGQKNRRKNASVHRRRDPFLIRQLAAKKAAFMAHRQQVEARKREEHGTPIHGAKEPTPFVKSFESAIPDEDRISTSPPSGSEIVQPPTHSNPKQDNDDPTSPHATLLSQPPQLNYDITRSGLCSALEASKRLTAPQQQQSAAVAAATRDPEAARTARELHATHHGIAGMALARILAVENASSRERTRVNTRRCIERFGRHCTEAADSADAARRIGPDTGSSEVQIAVLTAKIKVMAREYEEGTARNDKLNKRNLRLLLHKRAKLLKYFMRKDKMGKRWHDLVETLGLTPATWEGEIAV